MKNRNLNNSDHWKTPDSLYNELDKEFNFNFDPCPLHSTFDGLNIEWGKNTFINFRVDDISWKKLNAQNVLNINWLNVLTKDQTENVDILHDVKNVYQLKVQNEVETRQEKNTLNQKNINYYSLDKQDALSVKLSNHLMRLIFLLTKNVKQDIVPLVKIVKEKVQENVCQEDETILQQQILLSIREINMEHLIKVGKVNEKAALLEIINVDNNFSNGHMKIGNIVNCILKMNVPIVEQRQYLLKTILYLYHVIHVQEQYQQIWSQHVENVIVPKEVIIPMNGVRSNLYNLLIDISNISLKIEHKTNVFINPPYSRKLKELFIRKAYAESLEGKLCVMLLPVSTSTKIFHEIIYPHAEIRFLKGRVKFEGINTFGEMVSNKVGMHDSMVVIFNKGE